MRSRALASKVLKSSSSSRLASKATYSTVPSKCFYKKERKKKEKKKAGAQDFG
jgi:hypothetical protein